jgi:hypothetical protein
MEHHQYFFDAGERIFPKNLDRPKTYTMTALNNNDRRDNDAKI